MRMNFLQQGLAAKGLINFAESLEAYLERCEEEVRVQVHLFLERFHSWRSGFREPLVFADFARLAWQSY